MNAFMIGAISASILLIITLVIFNKLVTKRQKVRNAWADIDVWLKRRADIIPSLVETVKGYAAYESKALEDIAKQRTDAIASSTTMDARAKAEESLSPPLGRLILIAEDYPDLKASENFLELQHALAECEEKIEMSRRYYNGVVKEFNTFSSMFPISVIASIFGFKVADYFGLSNS